ncbi:MAG: RNA 3'-terminal phosphate cyclase [Phycisphaerae bacterium]
MSSTTRLWHPVKLSLDADHNNHYFRGMIQIDGSFGEGGGQILRSSLALSVLTAKPFVIHSIRAKRDKPGLRQQHLTAVRAAARVGNASLTGAEIGSSELAFTPNGITAGDHYFDVGTAGSATLVLQTVLPPLCAAAEPSRLRLLGGTHNPHAPPFDFLAHAFLPLVNRMGPTVAATLVRPGFFPAGGGEVHVDVAPAQSWHPLELLERGAQRTLTATAYLANLPLHIAERELATVADALKLSRKDLFIREAVEARGPGNAVIITAAFENITEVFVAFGQRGVPAEHVAKTAARAARDYLQHDAPVGEYLADQLLLPLALAGGGAFRTRTLSQHAETNMAVIRKFLDVQFGVEPGTDGDVTVRIPK